MPETKHQLIIVAVCLSVLSLIGGGALFISAKNTTEKACTLEAKICPDGSTVGRTGPDCEFTACPVAASPIPATESSNSGQLIGGQKDEHGCLIGAGYSWCEIKQKCLRTWEENCGN